MIVAAFVFWCIVWSLVGYAAAERRQFSKVAGVLGGLLLGPLSVLMFLASGVTQGDRPRRPFLTSALIVLNIVLGFAAAISLFVRYLSTHP